MKLTTSFFRKMSYFDLQASRKMFGDKLVIFKFSFCFAFALSVFLLSVEVGSNSELNHLKWEMDVKYEVSGRNVRVSHH